MPLQILFSTSAARARLYDLCMTVPKGKRGKSGEVQLQGRPRVRLVYFGPKTDDSKTA